MRKLRLKEPVIEQKDHSVLVRIRHEPLASPEEIILSYLEDHETVRNKTAREICGIGSENKVKNVFNRLIKAKKIERLPGTSYGTATYRKKRS
jgi:ATP-dependent DNA helicase RecG